MRGYLPKVRSTRPWLSVSTYARIHTSTLSHHLCELTRCQEQTSCKSEMWRPPPAYVHGMGLHSPSAATNSYPPIKAFPMIQAWNLAQGVNEQCGFEERIIHLLQSAATPVLMYAMGGLLANDMI